MPHISVSSERELDLQSAEVGSGRTGARDPFWENAKLILMVLVVCGHALEPWLLLDPYVDAAYVWIYSFHMAAFAFISGRFSKADGSRKSIVSAAVALLVPYVIFQVIYRLMDTYAWYGEPLHFQWTHPYWLLWFLVSLFSWRLLLPLVARLPWAGALLLVIALTAGIFDQIEYDFSLSRILVFFPFFYAGFWWGRRREGRISQWAALPAVRLGARVLTPISVAAAWFLAPTFDTRWLYGSNPYRWLEVSLWEGVAVRLAVLASAAVMVTVFLAWVPRHRTSFTVMGGRTMTIFLIHGLVVKSWITWGGVVPIGDEAFTGYRVLIALGWGVAITLLLGSRPVSWVVRPLVEPMNVWTAWRNRKPPGETA